MISAKFLWVREIYQRKARRRRKRKRDALSRVREDGRGAGQRAGKGDVSCGTSNQRARGRDADDEYGLPEAALGLVRDQRVLRHAGQGERAERRRAQRDAQHEDWRRARKLHCQEGGRRRVGAEGELDVRAGEGRRGPRARELRSDGHNPGDVVGADAEEALHEGAAHRVHRVVEVSPSI